MTEYGFLQVLQALSYFKFVSGSAGFIGSTFGAFEGLFKEVAGRDEAVCDDADRIGWTVCWTVCWAAAYVEAKLGASTSLLQAGRVAKEYKLEQVYKGVMEAMVYTSVVVNGKLEIS